MRKLKLLIAAAALLVCAGVQAQKDVTSQYITNATLSNGTNGWTNVNFNTPVQGNNTVGYASECYAGWGSLEKDNYSLKQTITLPAGHYTLVNYSFFRYGLNADTDASKSLAYLVAGSDKVAVKTLGSITAAGYANSQAEGANAFDSKMYRNTVNFTIDADNTPIEIGLEGTFDLKQSWMICGMFELINNDILATMDAPFDVTGYITNPGFEYRDMTGWTQDPSGFFGTQSNSQSFRVGGYYAEKWQPAASGALAAGSFSQTLSDLPAGLYKLTANLGGNGTYVGLNGKTANWEADKDYTVGYVLAENEDLTITAGKTAEGTANWIHFDNFRLQFCGDVAAALTTLCADVTEYESKLSASDYAALQTAVAGYNKNYSDVDELLAAIDAVQALYDAADLYVAYTDALTAAQTVDQTAKMNNDVLTALQTAIATEITMSSTAADVVAATNALNTATTNATASIANYAEAKAILDAANTYDEAGQASYAANETIAAIQTAYNDGTLTALTADQKSAAAAALTAACKAQTQPADGCDMTAYIVNPGIDGNTTGWTTTKYENGGYTGGPMKPSNDAMEFWAGGTQSDQDKGKGFDYYQSISNLPNGVYTIGADLLNSTNGEEGATWNSEGQTGVYGKTNSAEVIKLVTTDSEVFASYTTGQIFVYDGTLTIGVKNIAPMTGRWFACDNFKLTYVRQLTDEDKNTVTSAYLAGSFNEWKTTALELAQVGETNSYACELDIEDYVDVTFKPVINGNWMDYTKFTFDAPNGWIENAGDTDNNIKLNNTTALYKTYTVTATWTPNLDVTAGWTLKIEGKDARPTTTFTASYINNDWNDVYAHVWNGTSDVITGNWPGQKLEKSGTVTDAVKSYDVYTYSYEGYEAPDHIIFNNGSGTQTSDLDFVDGMIFADNVTFSPVYYVVGSNQAKTDKAIFSGNWDAVTTTDEMTAADGKWTISFNNVTLTEPIIFKVIAKDYKEAAEVKTWYPSGDDVTISETGDFNIVITFDGTNVTYTATPLTELFTVTNAGWATAVSHYAVDFTGVDGLKAYTATVAEGKVTLAEAGAVPAGTALVLKGATKAVPVVESAEAVTNDLKG
ncbi:MAG: starch-binding protein, partial [Prevotella sp.]|nr:starch-binding protein [Prevotella sp.]